MTYDLLNILIATIVFPVHTNSKLLQVSLIKDLISEYDGHQVFLRIPYRFATNSELRTNDKIHPNIIYPGGYIMFGPLRSK